MNLYDYLQEYAGQGKKPMHMPGHKRNPSFFMENPYAWDVTEVEGLDNLHHPKGILKQEMERLCKRYHTEDSYLLVNGSTGGILAAIASCCRRGEKILVARNCHRSVYHAMFLLNLTPVYLYPKVDLTTGIALDISPEQVAKALERETVSCAILTSPTYEGIVSDIRSIADICHEREIPLIVDEAHGAHFVWGEQFPESAMEQGADLVIESLHKTLPALTQTALLHRVTEWVSGEMLMQYLAMFETSSPSYVLMASISQCISWLESVGEDAWTAYDERLVKLEQQAADWRHLQLWRHDKQERSKLIVGTWGTDMTGVQLAECLRSDYAIEIEMAAPMYILAMTSVADKPETLSYLADALTQIDDAAICKTGGNTLPPFGAAAGKTALVRMSAYEAFGYSQTSLCLEDCQGEVSAEYAYVYPPGIPFLNPGEEITPEVIEQFRSAKEYGLTLMGLEDETGSRIRICRMETGEQDR